MSIWRWLLLLLLSVLYCSVFTALHFPAAILLGALLAGASIALCGKELQLSRVPVLTAQAVVGLVIARSMNFAVMSEILNDWHLLLSCGIGVLVASSIIGWGVCRYLALPGSTGVWGLMPGAATAVTLMADAHGADARLVALMQCSRIALVALLAAGVSWHGVVASSVAIQWFPPTNYPNLTITLLLLFLCTLLGGISRIPAGPLLMAILCGGGLQGSDLIAIELPPLLLVIGYMIIGWNIGLRFTRSALLHAVSVLPGLLLAIMLLIGLCGLMAMGLVTWAGVTPLTAYLATSPGGVDSIAIIAAGSDVDMPFVMAFQTVRFLLVIFLGPVLARWIAKHAL